MTHYMRGLELLESRLKNRENTSLSKELARILNKSCANKWENSFIEVYHKYQKKIRGNYLLTAIYYDNIPIAKYLITLDAPDTNETIHAKEKRIALWSNAMRVAIYLKRFEIIDFFLENGYDINSGENSLIAACMRHKLYHYVKILLRKGSSIWGRFIPMLTTDINNNINNNSTSKILIDICEIIIENHDIFDHTTYYSRSLFHCLIRIQHYDMCQKIWNQIFPKTKYHFSLVMDIIRLAQKDNPHGVFFESIVENFNIDVKYIDTAFWCALRYKNVWVLELILVNHAYINPRYITREINDVNRLLLRFTDSEYDDLFNQELLQEKYKNQPKSSNNL